jgi:transposase
VPRQKGTPNIPQEIVHEIITQHRAGTTVRELMKAYGKTFYTIRNIIKRENKKSKSAVPLKKSRGRKPAITLQEYKYENKRLLMENELLRDFLHLAGRK